MPTSVGTKTSGRLTLGERRLLVVEELHEIVDGIDTDVDEDFVVCVVDTATYKPYRISKVYVNDKAGERMLVLTIDTKEN